MKTIQIIQTDSKVNYQFEKKDFSSSYIRDYYFTTNQRKIETLWIWKNIILSMNFIIKYWNLYCENSIILFDVDEIEKYSLDIKEKLYKLDFTNWLHWINWIHRLLNSASENLFNLINSKKIKIINDSKDWIIFQWYFSLSKKWTKVTLMPIDYEPLNNNY